MEILEIIVTIFGAILCIAGTILVCLLIYKFIKDELNS